MNIKDSDNFIPIWPTSGTLPEKALCLLCRGRFTYAIPAEDTEVKEWLAAIGVLQTYGWPITFREIRFPGLGPIPKMNLGVWELEQWARIVASGHML